MIENEFEIGDLVQYRVYDKEIIELIAINGYIRGRYTEGSRKGKLSDFWCKPETYKLIKKGNKMKTLKERIEGLSNGWDLVEK